MNQEHIPAVEIDSRNGHAHNILLHEIRSDEVQEILSFVPHWIIRWGITSIFLAVIILLLACWFIKYPDVITSRITLTTQNAPANIVARSSGKFSKLLVVENQLVRPNEYLAIIENSAYTGDIITLIGHLNSINALGTDSIEWNNYTFPKNLNIGELQSDYLTFVYSISEYKNFVNSNFYLKKIDALEKQIEILKQLTPQIQIQKELLAKDVELAEKNLAVGKSLYEKKIASEIELANYESSYIQKKYSYQNAENSLINNLLQITEQERSLIELNEQFEEKRRTLRFSLDEAFKRLQSSFSSWEQRYVLKAPIEGNVSFFKYWSDNQFVNANDEVMSVVPEGIGVLGKTYVVGTGSGKLKIGQKVKIKLDGYPFSEYGIVDGIVESISIVAKENQFLVNVALPNGLESSYKKRLDFKQGMEGTSEILTEDLRLIERIFYQFKTYLNR
ncbi:HlyD family efflux transporter periplasmic adaptor subunit [bacterium]|nr:HlyD family efflux transporter periplasmic adaptor subunit [bacterium]